MSMLKPGTCRKYVTDVTLPIDVKEMLCKP